MSYIIGAYDNTNGQAKSAGNFSVYFTTSIANEAAILAGTLIQSNLLKKSFTAQMESNKLNFENLFNFKGIKKYYFKYFKDYKRIHSSCEDYRAGATIDLIHDKKDLNKKSMEALIKAGAFDQFAERNQLLAFLEAL